MRTTLLIAMVGTLAAAEAPKPKPELSTAERIALGAVVAESKKLGEQQKALSEQFDTIRREACQRLHGLDKCEITDQGQVLPLPVKAEVKK